MQFSDADYRDIQGLARFGFGHLKEAVFLLERIADPAAARAWLAATPVTNAIREDRLPQHALQVAFTFEGLQALGVSPQALGAFSDEFQTGMTEKNRSRRLGDTAANDPERWHWGKPGEAPHVLIMLYAPDGGLAAWEAKVKGAGFASAFTPYYRLSTSDLDDAEPFGFIDGISQPVLDWQREKPTRLRDTTEYTNVAALGEFLLGYPNEYGRYTDRPLLDPHDDPRGILPMAEDVPGKKDLGRNGSYLVLRDLAQDVAGFWRFVKAKSGDEPLEEQRLAGAMAGRLPPDIKIIPPVLAIGPVDDPPRINPQGVPVARLSEESIDGVGPELLDIWRNQLTFKSDPDGTGCPYGAHIRRANPRSADLPLGTRGVFAKLMRTLGFASKHPHEDLVASTRFHRILRRGREYIVEPGRSNQETERLEERGLRFMCLNANIARQFEFVQISWLANAKFNGLDEDDPLVGNRAKLMTGAAVDTFTRLQDDGMPCRVQGLPQFVTVNGGAYFFMPGIAALQYIASDPAARS